MCRLIESIRLQDGQFYHLDLHEQRMAKARKELFFCREKLNLQNEILCKNPPLKGLFKCRVLYDTSIRKIEFLPYQPRKITSLKLVYSDEISYSHKFENREELNRLYNSRLNFDEILIVKKQYITDTSFSNIIFFDGKEWLTPSTYLLNGIQRQNLLINSKIREMSIKVNDLTDFLYAKLINAMLPFSENQAAIKIEDIR